jgi:hypothetical protein
MHLISSLDLSTSRSLRGGFKKMKPNCDMNRNVNLANPIILIRKGMPKNGYQ